MLLQDFSSNVKILTVLKWTWNSSDAKALPRKFHALSLRVKGKAQYTVGKKKISVQAGDVLFVPENLGYHIQAGEEELYVIHFELAEKKQDFLEVFHMNDYIKVKRLFSDCYDVWSAKKPGYQFKALSIFYHILELMSLSALNNRTDESYLKLEEAISYLHANYTDPDLSVLKLCKIAHLSDTWFRKLFYKCYNTTPVKYINDLRISYAKELIASGYYKIEQIALMAGFDDPKYFSTVFKNHTGLSPSDYKDFS